eukprot:Phypoly_transcript_04492.p1 GENE.Phypoly_transcript_04492~~Phypoly_transcript_04492.p1  ORF type:complete len:512 (+),score=76.74 Phypoly_transcript_04492:273-1808(+)
MHKEDTKNAVILTTFSISESRAKLLSSNSSDEERFDEINPSPRASRSPPQSPPRSPRSPPQSPPHSPPHSPRSKTEEEKVVNMRDFLYVAWVTFIGEMSRGVVVPVLWPYLQSLNGSLEFLGLVTSAYSFSRFFAAPFFGWWSNWRGHKEVLLISTFLLVVGNIMYALYPPPWVLLLSRIIVGLGAGTLGQSRGYVSQVTTKSQRTRYMAYLTVSQFAGFAVTPGVTSLLSVVDFDLFGIERLEADAYSSAGYLMAVLSFATFVLVAVCFVEPPKQEKPEAPAVTSQPATKRSIKSRLENTRKSICSLFSHPEIKKIVLFATLIFATRTAVAVIETASSEISGSAFGWDSQKLSYVLCAMGVVGTVILVSLPNACEKLGYYGEGLLLSVGVFSLSLGLLLMAFPSLVTFILGLLFVWAVGSSMCQTLIMSFLSQVLHPDSQGAIMGWLASLGSISRIVGALWAGATLGLQGGTYIALGVPAFLMVPCFMGTSYMVIKMIRDTREKEFTSSA